MNAEEPTAPVAGEPITELAADAVVEEGPDKPKRARGRGRGRRRASESVTESTAALSVSDLKAQLLEDDGDAGTTATKDDAEKPKRGRRRGRPHKGDTEAQAIDSAPEETTGME